MYQYVWNESISGTWVTRSRIQMGDGSKFVSFIKKQTRPGLVNSFKVIEGGGGYELESTDATLD